jgi:hypothetical protein
VIWWETDDLISLYINCKRVFCFFDYLYTYALISWIIILYLIFLFRVFLSRRGLPLIDEKRDDDLFLLVPILSNSVSDEKLSDAIS